MNAYGAGVLGVIASMMVAQNSLDPNRSVSLHCAIRNIGVLVGGLLVKQGFMNLWVLMASIFTFEFSMDILNHYGISFDSYENKVINFYRWADTLWSSSEMKKINTYTEGGYNANAHMGLAEGNIAKFKWMAEQGKITEGTRVLELGSGNGEFLMYIKNVVGAAPVGLCNSAPQHKLNTERGLEIVLADIWEIPESLHGKFDVVVMNGSTEHFCTWKTRKEMEPLLSKLFGEVNKCLAPDTKNGRVVITAITCHREWSLYEKAQIYLLERTYGGYYAQFTDSYERNAEPHGFNLVVKENHTVDYYIWARKIWWHVLHGLTEPGAFMQMLRDVPVFLLNDPYYIHKILHIITGAWCWQFEVPYLPMLSEDDTPPFLHQWIVLEKKLNSG